MFISSFATTMKKKLQVELDNFPFEDYRQYNNKIEEHIILPRF